MSTFAFRSSGVPESARVVAFVGDEALSTLFSFEIHVIIPDDDCADLDLDGALGARGTLTIDAGEEAAGPIDYHGMISDIELVHAQDGMALLRLGLSPRLFSLTEGRHSRMFTQKPIPDIISAVLDEGGFSSDDYELRLRATPSPESHVCQYKERDLDFLSRWMDREGMYYFFDCSGDVEKALIVDDASAHEPCCDEPVRYHPVSSRDVSAGSSFSWLRERTSALPASVKVKDQDYASPSLDVSSDEAVSSLGAGDVVMFGGRFFTPSEAARLAKLRAEGHKAGGLVVQAGGSVYGLRSGYTFELEGHARDRLNQSYLITAAHHEGHQAGASPELEALIGRSIGEGYRVEITAIPASVQFRRAFEAPWPRIHGFEHGTVDGPADSDYAQLDDQGRYAVKIHFDETDLSGGKASTRVRMMQPHAGNPEGFHFPLRKGSEVAIGFIGGDPDRPFIAGFVPNAENPSPVTRSNHKQNVIQTGGRTRIEIDDTKDKQYIDISTPPKDTFVHLGEPHGKHTHYIVENTQGDCLFEIGGNQDIHVGGKLTETVKGSVSETYKTSQTSTIDGTQRTTVNQPVFEFYKSTQHTVVKGLRIEEFNGGHLTLVGGARTEEYTVGQEWVVLGPTTEDYKGGLTRMVTGSTNELYTDALSVHVTGPVVQIYPSGVNQKYGATDATWKKLTWLAGNIKIDAPNWTIITPQHMKFFGGWKDCRPTLWKKGVLSNSTTAIKIERTKAVLSGTGLKADMTGIKLALQGTSREAGGIKLDTGIIKIKAAGIKKYI